MLFASPPFVLISVSRLALPTWFLVFPLLGFTVPCLRYYSMVTWKVGMGSPEALVMLPDLITRIT